jgi:ribonuclease III
MEQAQQDSPEGAGEPGRSATPSTSPREALLARLRREGVLIDAPSAEEGPHAAPEHAALTHLDEALTHPSFANEQRPGQRLDNQRLEFLGDAVLGLCASELLMRRFPSAKEGDLSLMRSLLVNTEALAAWARVVELGHALRLGRGADTAGERARDTVLADAVEALVGAIYLDRGFDAARGLSAVIVAEPLARLKSPRAASRDPKSELQEQVQAEGGPSPRYRVTSTEGPDHLREFVVVVEVSGAVLGEGRGRSKKLAEQTAARAAIDARRERVDSPDTLMAPDPVPAEMPGET